MALRSHQALFFIAGITFSTPIRAVLSTPQTTFFMRHPREWRSPDLSRPRRLREMRSRPEGHGRARTGGMWPRSDADGIEEARGGTGIDAIWRRPRSRRPTP